MCVGASTHDVTYSVVPDLTWSWGVRAMASGDSVDGRGISMFEPLSSLHDVEAELGVEGFLVNGLDEEFELPYIEGDLGGSLG